jgi:hypothetical protein
MKANITLTPKILYEAKKAAVPYLRSDLTLRTQVLGAMEVLPWASKRHIQLWVRGEAPKRDSGIEGTLLQLVDEEALRAVTYKSGFRDLAYTARKKINKYEIPHYLANSECLARFKVAGDALPISENELKGQRFKVVAEGGFFYPNRGTLLLLEYSSARDWKKTRRLTRKIAAYRNHIGKIGEAYGATPFVLFVVDVDRELVARLVDELAVTATDEDPFYFTDYETFKKVEMGQARNAEIYYFMDGKEYSL